MRIIVAGGRDFDDYGLMSFELSKVISFISSRPKIVSGGAKGADTLGEMYAKEYSYNIERFPANWDKYGKSAGYIRNEEMAKYSEMLVAFWDGKSKGTEHMINLALKHGLLVKIVKYTVEEVIDTRQ